MKAARKTRSAKSEHPPKKKARNDDRPYLLLQAIENASDLISMTDLDQNVTFLNRAFLEAFGYSEQEVLGLPVRKVVSPDNPQFLHDELTKKLREGGSWKGEVICVRRDGTEFSLRFSVGPTRNEQGEVTGAFAIAQDVTAQKQAEEKLKQSEAQLRTLLNDAARLSELVEILQSCQSTDEAYRVAERALRTLLPTRSGCICVTSESRNIVEVVAKWGDELSTKLTFSPDDCWALRRGKIHIVDDAASPLLCAHIAGAPGSAFLCAPLAAQGETLGVFHLEALPSKNGSPSIESLAGKASAVAERISLALANLKLREALRRQSIRDPLTGLFNRRYMEETLERELSRAARKELSVALLMCDIDHFKRFNDTFGHQAGDVLLRALGDFLSQRTRGQDVACRYGGEEFVIILVESPLDAAIKRADIFREEVKHLSVQHAGQLLGTISLSIGVSAFPTHGKDAGNLLHAADSALYRAKAEGRDRVVLANA